MKQTFRLILAALILMMSTAGVAQTSEISEADELKIAALEGLMTAPPERALSIVKKVLAANHVDEVKSRALFVLSQIDTVEANELLIETAKTSTGDLQLEAIRMVGINGEPTVLAQLRGVYDAGDMDVKESVLHALLIADDKEGAFQIAENAKNDDEFELAVNILGAMGATEQLARLRGRDGTSESLIHAYAIAGDVESLKIIANDSSNPDRQIQAMHGLGIAGGDEVGPVLVEIFRNSANRDVREAAMHGLMIAGRDDSVLALFRESQDPEEKKDLLRLLVMMDSDAAITVIDEALGGGR